METKINRRKERDFKVIKPKKENKEEKANDKASFATDKHRCEGMRRN